MTSRSTQNEVPAEFLREKEFVRALLNILPNPLNNQSLGDEIASDLEASFTKAPSRAKKSLAIALADCIEMVCGLRLRDFQAIEQSLLLKHQINLGDFIRSNSERVNRLMKKKKLTSEVDYYILRGVLDITADPVNQEKIAGLLRAFEDRQR